MLPSVMRSFTTNVTVTTEILEKRIVEEVGDPTTMIRDLALNAILKALSSFFRNGVAETYAPVELVLRVQETLRNVANITVSGVCQSCAIVARKPEPLQILLL